MAENDREEKKKDRDGVSVALGVGKVITTTAKKVYQSISFFGKLEKKYKKEFIEYVHQHHKPAVDEVARWEQAEKGLKAIIDAEDAHTITQEARGVVDAVREARDYGFRRELTDYLTQNYIDRNTLPTTMQDGREVLDRLALKDEISPQLNRVSEQRKMAEQELERIKEKHGKGRKKWKHQAAGAADKTVKGGLFGAALYLLLRGKK